MIKIVAASLKIREKRSLTTATAQEPAKQARMLPLPEMRK
jgi:hypothetical protein